MGIYNTDRTCQISLQYGISIYTSMSSEWEFWFSHIKLKFCLSSRCNILSCYSFNLYLFWRKLTLFVFKRKFIICINTYIYFPFLNCQDYEFFIVQSSDPGHLGKLPAACHCLLFPLKTILLRPALWVSPK